MASLGIGCCSIEICLQMHGGHGRGILDGFRYGGERRLRDSCAVPCRDRSKEKRALRIYLCLLAVIPTKVQLDMRAFSRFVRPVASQAIGSIHHSVRPVASSYPRTAASPLFLQLRRASGASLSKDDISSRILVVLKSFEKVDPTKVGGTHTI